MLTATFQNAFRGVQISNTNQIKFMLLTTLSFLDVLIAPEYRLTSTYWGNVR